MPKVPLNFQNTVIYKIVCNDLNIEDVYVGHTTNFTKRKYRHKSNSQNLNGNEYEYKIYKTIREYGGFENWSMIEIEKYPCNDLQEASKRERYYYELLNAKLNTVNPSRSKKEYQETNNDKMKIYHKKYREMNKAKTKIERAKQILCDCCGIFTISRHITRHQATKKHIENSNILNEEDEIQNLELELTNLILKK
jgi:hypothetical protein